jgi:integrase
MHPSSRGRRSAPVLSDGDFRSLVRTSPPETRRLLLFLWRTGCRVPDAVALHWADVDWDHSCAILRPAVTKRRRPLVVHFDGVVMRLLAWLRRRDASAGPVFRTSRGYACRRGVRHSRLVSRFRNSFIRRTLGGGA